jgi:phosphoglycerate dehydrogenase-like enzyme
MRQVSVLLSANFDAAQVEAIRAAHPAIVLHGAEGGYAIEPPSGMDAMEMTYPRYRPDIDIDAILKSVEVIIACRLPRGIHARAPHLRWVQYIGAGLDHLMPADELRRANYVITNFSGVHAIPLAETVLTMMLTLVKSWSLFHEQQRRHIWQRHVIGELHGKTVGIIGLGRVGREIARVCSCMGMRVVAVRRSEPTDVPVEHVEKVLSRTQLHTLLAESDFVVGSAPSTPETYHMLGEAELRRMKPGAYLINVGRGQLIDEPVLVRALGEGWIAGAGLDVFEEEPLPEGSPLWDLPNVFVLPHQGSDTFRYLDRGVDLIRDNLRRYIDGSPLLNVVDPSRGY